MRISSLLSSGEIPVSRATAWLTIRGGLLLDSLILDELYAYMFQGNMVKDAWQGKGG
jgi:hypothetical protein